MSREFGRGRSCLMSLNAWKLEVCSSGTTSASTTFAGLETGHRKPPKSNICAQLRRLKDLSYDEREIVGTSARNEEKKATRSAATEAFKDEGIVEEKDERSPGVVKRRNHSCSSDLFSTVSSGFPDPGPFEPLVLSSPDEPLVQVPASISCRLFKHQMAGVKFLYNLYKNNHGGVLGDDMGLGKTIQTIAFIAAVIGKDTEHGERRSNKDGKHMQKSPILIICPTSVITNWGNEFSEWGDFSFSIYHGPNRDLILERLVGASLDILITSFDTFRIHDKLLCDINWNIVVVDEAHRLKNEKSGLYKACLGLKTRRRFGLTGTIMQNKILELFNLFDWVSPGSLGTREHFRDFYEEPLKHGQRLSAPKRFLRLADERKQHLSKVLQKYLLRRTKEETIGHLMLGKEDNVVFCTMSDLQKRAYRRMLDQPEIHCLINKDLPCLCGSPLKQVECCKRIVPDGILWSYLHRDNPDGCDSCPFCLVLPCIIKLQQISNHLELIKPNPKDEIEKQKKDAELASAIFSSDIDLVGGNTQCESFMELSDVKHCGKMRALERLSASWIANGDKILLFSYSVRVLDILEKFLIRRGYCFSRLDGSTPMSLRQSLVDDFNRSPSKQVFLISTRAGGLGLNLVSANRVVIFDPNWNPAQDLQAQDRSFRYGQKRHVVVFRLLAAGSLEELVYSRQVYKQQLSNIAVSGKMEKRYFEGVQDCKEFQGELFGICNIFRDLSDKLFTSEIIEQYEKRGPYQNHDTTEAEDMGLVSIKNAENESKFHDLGIVYTHRNEDVVNMGPSFHSKEDFSCSLRNDDISRPCLSERTWLDGDKEKIPFSNRKREEFLLIAKFMGMEELQFSRWILGASTSKLEEVLHNYKKQKTSQLPSSTTT